MWCARTILGQGGGEPLNRDGDERPSIGELVDELPDAFRRELVSAAASASGLDQIPPPPGGPLAMAPKDVAVDGAAQALQVASPDSRERQRPRRPARVSRRMTLSTSLSFTYVRRSRGNLIGANSPDAIQFHNVRTGAPMRLAASSTGKTSSRRSSSTTSTLAGNWLPDESEG